MASAPTIDDVARRAGVSAATVSRALRGLPHVSPRTRERVQRIAEQLDYRPNPHASRLAAGRSGTIGIAVPVLNSWYYGNLLAGMQTVLSKHDTDMHLIIVDDEESILRFAKTLPSLAKQVDALAFCSLAAPDMLWNEILISGLPAVTLGIDTTLFDAVRIDDEASAQRAVEYLLELGHCRIAFIGGGDDEVVRSPTGEARQAGYRNAIAARGRAVGPVLEEAGGFRVEDAARAMNRLLSLSDPPTAVFAASDEMAFGAMSAIRAAGLRVPEDISVVGFDDHLLAGPVGLTTVRQPVVDMGALAMGRLMARLQGEDAPPHLIEAPTRLILRETTAPVGLT